MSLTNKRKYSISAMCKFLKIARSTLYYRPLEIRVDVKLQEAIQSIFKSSRNNYGTRKIKIELRKIRYHISRRKIRRIMSEFGLVSNYTVKQYKVHKNTCNNDKIGNEFKNKIIDEVLKTFEIKRSLRAKGCPYDNVVAEEIYKVVKTKFAFNRRFQDFGELERELFDYVNWYNNIRIHGSLGYLTPGAYRQSIL